MLSRRLLRIKVVKALYAHWQGGADVSASRKGLRESIDRAYELYVQMLWLVVEVKRYAEARIELGKKKHRPTPEERSPNLKFVENDVIRRIEEDEAIVNFLDRHKLGWLNYPELVKEMYNLLTASPFYVKYMEGGRGDWADDAAVVRDFYSAEALEDNELLEDVLEEQSVMWNDDLGFALVMVVRTIEKMRAGQTEVPLLPKFKSDEDPAFAETLLVRAVAGYDEYLAMVEKFTRNWDVERIALVDNLIMTTAIAEMAAFPEIPVKVTLDEFIEIAKYYSTPGSNAFINGVLDKVVETMAADGRIAKTGKGLE